MYSNKGAYALLLGSGIFRSAHIPSGWEVEVKLIQKLGASQGVTEPENWHKWYKDNYQQHASYSSLLGEIVKTPTERVQLILESAIIFIVPECFCTFTVMREISLDLRI